MSGFVAVKLSAFRAFVYDYIALFGVGHDLDRLHWRATFAGAVAGIYVDVKRPKAKGAVIARGVAERLDLLATMGADKSVVVFCKSFLFHKNPNYLIFALHYTTQYIIQ